MTIKAELKTVLLDATGLTDWRWKKRPAGLYCFNYHRIGDAEKSKYDPNVFSCTEKRFFEHVEFFKQNFRIISVDQLIGIIDKGSIIEEPTGIITFDDGYIDNYTNAFPILDAAKISAAFYVPTDYIDKPQIPWWDEISWHVRHTELKEIKLFHWKQAVDIKTGNIRDRTRRILRAFKSDKNPMAEKLAMLREITGFSEMDCRSDDSLFMNWSQLSEMQNSGMHIGSHTCSHSILSHLSQKQQAQELKGSKKRLDEMLEVPATTLAYPVGGADAFTVKSQDIARQCDYKMAFSFIPGINTALTKENIYKLRRIPVSDNLSCDELRRLINKLPTLS